MLAREAGAAGLWALDDAMAKSQRCSVQLDPRHDSVEGRQRTENRNRSDRRLRSSDRRSSASLHRPILEGSHAREERLTTVLEQVAVAYGSFDTIYEDSVSAPKPPT